MANSAKVVWASIAFALLTIAGLLTAYQISFDVWMTAYPFADAKVWRKLLYIRLTTEAVVGLCWSMLLVWFFRQRRNRSESVASKTL